MYLHKKRELLKDIITKVSKEYNTNPSFIEKDYYITVILKSLIAKCPNIIFKGGTSLSKCYGIINRFSEDIDISFQENIGESKRSKLKNNIIKSISDELELPIINWDLLHSNNNVNKYIFLYTSTINTTIDFEDNIILETSLMLPSFPTITKTISNYIYEYFKYTDKDIISIYDFFPFKINCQSLERTFIDKVFATCDYYILNKSTRLSRHLYDIHMLYPMIKDFNLSLLIDEVRNLRSKIDLCPSAKQSIDINKLLKEIIDSNYYKNDYENVTLKLIYDNVSYEDVIETLKQIIATKIFI